MSKEDIQLEMQAIKELASKEVILKLDDISYWHLRYPWSKDTEIDIDSDNGKYNIFICEDYLSIHFKTQNLFYEEFIKNKKSFFWVKKHSEPKSDLRKKIESLVESLRNQHEAKILLNELNYLKDALKE